MIGAKWLHKIHRKFIRAEILEMLSHAVIEYKVRKTTRKLSQISSISYTLAILMHYQVSRSIICVWLMYIFKKYIRYWFEGPSKQCLAEAIYSTPAPCLKMCTLISLRMVVVSAFDYLFFFPRLSSTIYFSTTLLIKSNPILLINWKDCVCFVLRKCLFLSVPLPIFQCPSFLFLLLIKNYGQVYSKPTRQCIWDHFPTHVLCSLPLYVDSSSSFSLSAILEVCWELFDSCALF